MNYQQSNYVQAGSYPQQGFPQQGIPQQGYSVDPMMSGAQGLPLAGGMQQGLPLAGGMQSMGGMQTMGGVQSMGGMQQGMMMGGQQHWASQFNNPAQSMMYKQFFDAGDFSRSGFLDQNGLQAALLAAGEREIDAETVPLMIQMFDVDGNGRIDFNEFSTLMGYVNSMKNNYIQNAAQNNGVGVSSRDISAMMNNTHGQFVNEIGGEDAVMNRGILPTIMPTNSGFFTLGNFIKIAIIIGILRTLYTHNKLPFINNSSHGQQTIAPAGYGSAAGYQPQMVGQQYNTGYGQPQMMTPGAAGAKPQHGGIMGRIMSSFGRH